MSGRVFDSYLTTSEQFSAISWRVQAAFLLSIFFSTVNVPQTYIMVAISSILQA